MSYKTIFSGSAGPFSGILRPRVAGLMTLRFFAKRLFSRDLWLGLYSDGFRVAWLVARALCHWVVVIAGATAFAAATLVAFFIAGAALWIYNPILTRLIGRK